MWVKWYCKQGPLDCMWVTCTLNGDWWALCFRAIQQNPHFCDSCVPQRVYFFIFLSLYHRNCQSPPRSKVTVEKKQHISNLTQAYVHRNSSSTLRRPVSPPIYNFLQMHLFGLVCLYPLCPFSIWAADSSCRVPSFTNHTAAGPREGQFVSGMHE